MSTSSSSAISRISHLGLITIGISLIFGLSFAPNNAEASTKPWVCKLEFDARGTDIQILIGYSKISGLGDITCTNQQDGQTTSQRVGVVLGTPVVFPRISFGPSIHVKGTASVPMDSGDPRAFLGTYLTVDARLGRSILMLQLLKQNSSLAFDLDLEGVDGFGIAVGGTTVEIN
ncbi:MAG: hypothetical protein IPJ84_10865 [Bdellovibrionales bacterium]|nr:hypothetical protein [Bdellovibrionales bacterium]